MSEAPPAQRPLRLAIVGCGAAAERLHLPVLGERADRVVTTLVDPAEQRARALAAKFGVPHVVTDHRQLEDIDAAIVVVPNALHAPVAVDLMQAGIDVLVEKPVAATVADVDEMARVATETRAVVGVGMELRFSAVAGAAKGIIDSGALGKITSFSAAAGVRFSWPVATPYILQRGTAGGGALIDVGVHTIDLLLWWLGDASEIAYRDDNYGGVEADGLLELALGEDVRGTVEVSRTRDLGHVITVRGDRGELEVGVADDRLRLSVSDLAGVAGQPPADVQGGRDDVLWSMAAEHDDFLDAVRQRRDPAVPLGEARRSLAVIEAAYAVREEWQLPWVRPGEVTL